MPTWHGIVAGRVQGVSYRYSTREQALQLGLVGWVRNLADGRVEVWAQGESSELQALLQWLWQGPELALVSSVEGRFIETQQRVKGFVIQPSL